jgi:uncharacterized membrane protein AbrB (regulator of aidB expression)
MNPNLIAPVVVAAACAWLLEFSRFASAALIGAAIAVGLIVAGRRVTVRFAALAFGVALAFGFTAMMFAELIGLPVRELLERPLDKQVVAITLAWVAVMFVGLGLVAAAWGMWRNVPEADEEGKPPG